MLRPVIDAARAAKAGLAAILSALQLPPTGGPAGLTVLYRCPFPGQAENLPRAAIVGALDHDRTQVDDEIIDHGDTTVSVRVGTVSGTLQILLAGQDPTAGSGGAEADVDVIVAALEQTFNEGAGGQLVDAVPPAALHGVAVTVPSYHNGQFVYTYEGAQDPPLELVLNGIAEVVVKIGVVGPIYEIVAAPLMDPRLALDDGTVIETVTVDRSYPDDGYPD